MQSIDHHYPTGILRATNVLKHYRGFVWPENEALQAYVQKLLADPAVKRTCSTEELYLDSYERSVFACISAPHPSLYAVELESLIHVLMCPDTLSTAQTRARLPMPLMRGGPSRDLCMASRPRICVSDPHTPNFTGGPSRGMKALRFQPPAGAPPRLHPSYYIHSVWWRMNSSSSSGQLCPRFQWHRPTVGFPGGKKSGAVDALHGGVV